MRMSEMMGELDDNQIERLLQTAEARLRGTESETSKTKLYKQRKSNSVALPESHMSVQKGIVRADQRHLVDQNDRMLASGVRKVEDPIAVKQQSLENKQATAGSNWFNLPKTNMTPELKRDLQLLRMRNVLDPHRHYKKDGNKAKAPEFSQVGTLIEGPTEFYSARLTNAQRKKSLVEEVLSGERETGRFKRKYGDLQAAKTSGKKGYYKALMAKKYKKSYRNK